MCKRKSKTWISCFLVSLPISVFIIAMPMQANAYFVSGNVTVNTYGGDTIDRSTYDGSNYGGTATSLSDSASSQGDGGTSAESAYFVDLSIGHLGTYISGDNPNAAEGVRASAGAEVSAGFQDALTFFIPAGSYASDLYVSLNGFVDGYLSAFGCDSTLQNKRCANVYQTYLFSFGSDVFNTSIPEYAYPDTSPNIISENFTLTTRILTAGDYQTDQTVSLSVSARLDGKGTALWLYPSNADTSSSFVADFYNTGGFTSLATPDGVTWTSDSGVFLSAVLVDTDNDGVFDSIDNCTLVSNPVQRDTDSDGFGNICDPDFDNTLVVNASDLAYLKSVFFTTDPHADLDGSGVVNAGDLAILKSMFFGPPGPSGLVP